MRTCIKCGEEKPLSEYYKRKDVPSGYRNDCKECFIAKIKEVKSKNREYYLEFDRYRNDHNPNRRKRNKPYKYNRQKLSEESKKRRLIAARARYAVSVGKIAKQDSCSRCGVTDMPLEMHHEDYSKPLEVEWLCDACHGLTRKKPRDTSFKPKKARYA